MICQQTAEQPSHSLISPYISYGLTAWGQASKSHLEKLLILQKRAVRLINFLPFRTHAIPYFAQSNILPITMLYFKLSSILMFDITTNSAPQNICNLFTLTQDIHQYNTHSASSGNYYINHSRLNHHKESFRNHLNFIQARQKHTVFSQKCVSNSSTTRYF